jgi:hypothetical protein
MVVIFKVAFSAQTAITSRMMSFILYCTHFPVLNNAQKGTVESSTIASSIWLLTDLLLCSLAIWNGTVCYILDVSLAGAHPRMYTETVRK